MNTNLAKQRSIGALWMMLAICTVIGSVAFAQTVYNRFGPVTGVLKGDTSTYLTTPADSSDIIAMWTGTCADTTYLRGDGSCQVPPGGGGGTPGGLNGYVQYNDAGSFSGDAGLTYDDTTDTLTAGAVTVGTTGSFTGRTYNVTNGTQIGFLQADGTGISIGSSSAHPLSLYYNNIIECRILGATAGFDCIDGFTSNGGMALLPRGARASYFDDNTAQLQTQDTDGAGGLSISYVSFLDSTATELGYVGDRSDSNSDIYLTANTASANIRLTSGSGGSVIVNGSPILAMAAGTYTPTYTVVSGGISGSSHVAAQYMRLGSTLTVSGRVSLTTTDSSGAVLAISLPIASAMTNSGQCGGYMGASATASGDVLADEINDRAVAQITAAGAITTAYSYHFTCTIL